MLFATPASHLIFGILPWYSVLIVVAITLSIIFATRDEMKLGFPKDTVIDACFYIIPLGIIGARLYYVVFEWNKFSSNILRVLYIWEGGLAIYGGIIGGVLGAFLFIKKHNLKVGALLDLLIPYVVMSQGIGRWGNYFNQEAYGYLVTNPRHQFFPLSVFITHSQPPQWHYATFFYEFIWDFIVFFILLVIRKKPHEDGDIFLYYLFLYGLGRSLIESMRSDSLLAFGGTIRISQLLSICLILVVSFYFMIRKLRRKHNA